MFNKYKKKKIKVEREVFEISVYIKNTIHWNIDQLYTLSEARRFSKILFKNNKTKDVEFGTADEEITIKKGEIIAISIQRKY